MRQETIDRIRKFTDDRDWNQFHAAANLAKSIVIEAAELLECFQWSDSDYDLGHVNLLMTEVTSLYLPCGRTTLLSVFHIRLFA